VIFMLVKGVVSWKSIKQTLTTTSIIDVEYIAYYETTHQAI